ncbi:MAG: nucleoside hydrolase [Alphaproteobacteria bacterium]|nr:nucleoside hydrolase [Alphaproteobacteria bacterium]
MRKILGIAAAAFLIAANGAQAQPREKIIIDSDIGDDIDDAFALGLALSSPEFEILGVSASFGDTVTRVRMFDRMLGELGRSDIPVAMGTPAAVNLNAFTQRRYAEGGTMAPRPHPNAVDFVLEQARKYPGQVTLVAVGPLPNVGAMIDKDLGAFRLLKQVVIMGGSIRTMNDPLMPLDSTANLKFHEVARTALFAHGSMLTNILAGLYYEWSAATRASTPILYDPMTLASLLQPSLCPLTPLHITLDDAGNTKETPGAPNAEVCLHSDADAFAQFYVRRVTGP